MFCLHACLCTMYKPGAHRGQEKTGDPLELEIQVAVSCHVDTENQTLVRTRATTLLTAELPLLPQKGSILNGIVGPITGHSSIGTIAPRPILLMWMQP